MEHAGIRIDVPYLEGQIQSTGEKIRELEAELQGDPFFREWRKRFGSKAKLGSREQLATLLFDCMGFAKPEYTEKSKEEGARKRYKIDESTLEGVDHLFVKKYLSWTKLQKAKRTYLEGIYREVQDGFLHPSFNLHTVQTYRSSSSAPNFQNLPIRNPQIGEIIRRCFIPREGRALAEVDYSGIEVRIAACYHRDPVMLEYVTDPTKDMHRDMAAQLYMIEISEVSKLARYCAKNMYVFPEFYGSVYFQCAQHLWEAIDRMNLRVKLPGDTKEATGPSLKDHLKSKGITSLGKCDPKERPVPGTFEYHVKCVEEDFWGRRFKVYAAWKERWYADYRRDGYFTTLTGFRIGGLLDRNDVLNYPVQGSAFHCLLLSLLLMDQYLRKSRMESLQVGQIHDSDMGDVVPGEVQDYLATLKDIMTVQVPKKWPWIVTPLDIEAELTPVDGNWYEKKGWVEKGGIWQEGK